MTKDQIIEAIAKERALIAEAEMRVKNLLVELAKFAKWQVGDVVGFGERGVYKLIAVEIDDGGTPKRITAKRKDGDKWSFDPYYLEDVAIRLTLIDRPEAK